MKPKLRFALELPTRPSNHDSLLLICMVICIVSPPLFLQIQLPTPECRLLLPSIRGTQDLRAGPIFFVTPLDAAPILGKGTEGSSAQPS